MALSKEPVRKFLRKHPMLINSLFYGSFYTGAELARQHYIIKYSNNSTPSLPRIKEENSFREDELLFWVQKMNEKLGLLDDPSDPNKYYNIAQLKRYAIYGCCLAGPLLHGWYKWLDSFYIGTATKIVTKKLLVDQFILTPPLVVMFFVSMSLMEGKSDLLQELKAKFVNTFKTSCMYWLPVQFVNFLVVPPTFRVFYVSVAAFCWVNILCYLKSMPLTDQKLAVESKRS